MGTFGTLDLGLGLTIRNRRNSAPFVGPLDAFAGQLYSVLGPHRALSSYTGPCWRVRRSIDSGEEDVGFAPDGWVDSAWLLSVAAGGSLSIVRDYDKSGNGRDGVQATSTAQARCVLNGVADVGPNGRPCAFYDGVNDQMDIQNSLGFARNASALTMAANARATASGLQYVITSSRADLASIRAALVYQSATVVATEARSTDGGTLASPNRTITSATWQRLIARARYAEGFADIAANGSVATASITPAQNSPNTDSLVAPRLGVHPNGAGLLTGQIGTSVLARSALSLSTLDAALASLQP